MLNEAPACAVACKGPRSRSAGLARSGASGRASAALRAAAAHGRERWLIRGRARRGGHRLRRRRFLRGRLLLGDLFLRALLRHYALFLLAGRSGLLLTFLGLRLRLLRFLRHDRLPIVAAEFFSIRPRHCHIATAPASPAGPATPLPVSAPGAGPPVAQSINSTVWTTGITVPAAICVMQPILPAAITSGASFWIFATLRSRNLLASSGWRML